MPRYFFDIHDGEKLECDRSGLVLHDLREARTEAVRALPEIVRDVLPDGERRTVSVVIRCEDGNALFRASLTLNCEWTDS